jgi:hypothetical protein
MVCRRSDSDQVPYKSIAYETKRFRKSRNVSAFNYFRGKRFKRRPGPVREETISRPSRDRRRRRGLLRSDSSLVSGRRAVSGREGALDNSPDCRCDAEHPTWAFQVCTICSGWPNIARMNGARHPGSSSGCSSPGLVARRAVARRAHNSGSPRDFAELAIRSVSPRSTESSPGSSPSGTTASWGTGQGKRLVFAWLRRIFRQGAAQERDPSPITEAVRASVTVVDFEHSILRA